MTNKFEKRAAARTEYISPLKVKNLQSGGIYEARMVNFSDSGIGFGSDGLLEKGAKMYLCLQHSPYSPFNGVLEYYDGEVMWRKESKSSLFKHEYGIQLVSDSTKQDSSFQTVKKVFAQGNDRMTRDFDILNFVESCNHFFNFFDQAFLGADGRLRLDMSYMIINADFNIDLDVDQSSMEGCGKGQVFDHPL